MMPQNSLAALLTSPHGGKVGPLAGDKSSAKTSLPEHGHERSQGDGDRWRLQSQWPGDMPTPQMNTEPVLQ